MTWWMWVLVLLPLATLWRAVELMVNPQSASRHPDALFPRSPLAEAAVMMVATVVLTAVAVGVMVACL